MAESVRSIFYDNVETDIDKAFVERVISFYLKFISKNDAHLTFFGGVHLGSEKVRYIPSDTAEWLEEVLRIDDISDAQKALHELKEINPQFHVSGSLVNHSFAWAAHAIYNSNVDKKLKEQGMKAALNMAQIKFLTGGIVKRFPHPTDPIVAMSLYESLDMKSDLKREGSWLEVINKKSETYLERNGAHWKTISEMKDDRRCVLLINELAKRIEDMLTVLTRKFYIVKDANDRLASSSRLGTLDGETVIKDYMNRPRKLVEDMERISRDEHAFVKDDLIEDVMALVSTCSRGHLTKSVSYFSENFLAGKLHRETQRTLLIYMMDISRTGRIPVSNIPMLISHIRNIFRSSSTRRREVIEIKENIAAITVKALPDVRKNAVTACQIGLVLYIAARALAMSKYD